MSHAAIYTQKSPREAVALYIPRKNEGKAIGRHIYDAIDWAFSCNPLARRASDAATLILAKMARPPISVDTCFSIATSFRMAAVVRGIWHLAAKIPDLATMRDEKNIPKAWPRIAQEVTGVVAATFYAGLFATGGMALKAPADLFDAATSALELANAFQDLGYVDELKVVTQGEIIQAGHGYGYIDTADAQRIQGLSTMAQKNSLPELLVENTPGSCPRELNSKTLTSKLKIFDANIQYLALQALKALCSLLSAVAAYTMAFPTAFVLALGLGGIALSSAAQIYKANLKFELPDLSRVRLGIA